MDLAVLHRNRFLPLNDADVTQVGPNAYQVRIPTGSPMHKKLRRPATAEGWDGAIFLIDGRETEPAMGSGEGADIVVSAWVL